MPTLTAKPNPILARPSGRVLMELHFDSSFPITLTDDPETSFVFGTPPLRVSSETLYPGGPFGYAEFEALLQSEPTIKYGVTNDFGGALRIEQITFALKNTDGRFNAYFARAHGMRGAEIVVHAYDKNSGELETEVAVCELALFNKGFRVVQCMATQVGFAKLLDKIPVARMTPTDFPAAIGDPNGLADQGKAVPLGIGVGEKIEARVGAVTDDYIDFILPTGNCGIDRLWEQGGQFQLDPPVEYETLHRTYMPGGRYATAIRFPSAKPWPGLPLLADVQRAYPNADAAVVEEWKFKGNFHGAMARLDLVPGTWADDGTDPLVSGLDTGALVSGHTGVGLGAVLLDGLADRPTYLQAPYPDRFKLDTLTMEVWLYPRTAGFVGDLVLGPYCNRANTTSSWRIGWDGASQRARVIVAGQSFYSPADTLRVRRWTHLAVVINAAAGTLQIYTDGVLGLEVSASIAYGATQSPLTFGISGTNPPIFFPAFLGYARFSAVARTRREIQHSHYMGRRNPVELIREIEQGELREVLDEDAADHAAEVIQAIGDGVLKADGFVTEIVEAGQVLDYLYYLRDMQMSRTAGGVMKLSVAEPATETEARFGHNDEQVGTNIVEFNGRTHVSLAEATKVLVHAYRITGGSSRLQVHEALPVGRVTDPVAMPFTWDGAAEDCVGEFKAKRMRVRDEQLGLVVKHEGRRLRRGHLVEIGFPAEDIDAPYEVLSAEKTTRQVGLLLSPYDETIFPWQPANYREAVLADTPIGYWRLNERDGKVAVDSSREGHDGTYADGVVKGVPGLLYHDTDSAARFLGANSDSWVGIETDDGAFEFTGLAPFSIECWVKTNGRPAAGEQAMLVAKAPYLMVWINPNGSVSFERTSFGAIVTAANAVPDQTPTHIACVYTGGVLLTYVNGVQSASFADSSILANDPTKAVSIGRFGGDASGYAAHFFKGDIDEVAIYDYALSVTQVTAHYTAGTAIEPRLFPRDGLVAGKPRLKIGNAPMLWPTVTKLSGRSAGGVSQEDANGIQVTIDQTVSGQRLSFELQFVQRETLELVSDGVDRQWGVVGATTARAALKTDDGDTSYLVPPLTAPPPESGAYAFGLAKPKELIGPIKRLRLRITGRSDADGPVFTVWPVYRIVSTFLMPPLTDDDLDAVPTGYKVVDFESLTYAERMISVPMSPFTNAAWSNEFALGLHVGIAWVAAPPGFVQHFGHVTRFAVECESINTDDSGFGHALVYVLGPSATQPSAPAEDDPTGILMPTRQYIHLSSLLTTAGDDLYWVYARIFDVLGRHVGLAGPLRVRVT